MDWARGTRARAGAGCGASVNSPPRWPRCRDGRNASNCWTMSSCAGTRRTPWSARVVRAWAQLQRTWVRCRWPGSPRTSAGAYGSWRIVSGSRSGGSRRRPGCCAWNGPAAARRGTLTGGDGGDLRVLDDQAHLERRVPGDDGIPPVARGAQPVPRPGPPGADRMAGEATSLVLSPDPAVKRPGCDFLQDRWAPLIAGELPAADPTGRGRLPRGMRELAGRTWSGSTTADVRTTHPARHRPPPQHALTVPSAHGPLGANASRVSQKPPPCHTCRVYAGLGVTPGQQALPCGHSASFNERRLCDRQRSARLPTATPRPPPRRAQGGATHDRP